MTPFISLQSNTEKRACERISICRRVQLDASDMCITGETTNVSLTGVLIHTLDNLNPLSLQQAVTLYLITDSERSPGFPGRIIRIGNNLIGIELQKKNAAAFGLLLTKNVFKRG